MRSTLITDIAELTTVDPERRVLTDAAVVVEDERIAWIGPAADAPEAVSYTHLTLPTIYSV